MNLTTQEARAATGQSLRTKFNQYKNDRSSLEIQWMKNLRQYKSKYDPEVEELIPKDKSKVYPRDTHTKVTGFVAKMMEMLFPASDMNWDIIPTAFPNISQTDLQNIIDNLTAQFQAANPGTPVNITSKDIESAVQDFAKTRADNMKKECIDQLSNLGGDQVEYSELAKRAIRSGGIYGFGVVEGPQVRSITERIFKPDETTGLYVASEVIKDVPYYESVRVWDIYPDLSARTWREQEGIFRRYVMIKPKLRKLGERADFDMKVIQEYIKDNPTGNYTAQSYETELDNLRFTTNVARNARRKYEAIRYYGYLSGYELSNSGVDIPENESDQDILADVWLLEDKIIKIDTAPFGNNPADIYHAFIYEDDEDSSLTGTALTEILRDGQMRLCSVDRATQDNMASAALPIIEINDDLLSRGYNATTIGGGSTIHREGRGPEAQAPAVRQIPMDSHITELLNLRQTLTQVMDMESNLPSWMLGNAQPLGEAFRTSNNMSMMQGGANMLTKDIVRSFDRFTSSVIGSLVLWNMEFNDKAEIKGDYQVMAKGNLSLVAKEVRGAAMDQLLMTLTPDERALLKTRNVLIERFKARDLPTDNIVDEDTAKQILGQLAQARAQAQALADQEQQARTAKMGAAAQKDNVTAQTTAEQNQAKIAEILSRVEANLANAKGVKDRGQLEHIKLLLESLQQRAGAGNSQFIAGQVGAGAGSLGAGAA